jgi:flagellar basal body P-ring formation protein FlgA
MVFWSYLLLGPAANGAAIDNVLAPVEPSPAAAATTDEGPASAAIADDAAPQPLVAAGVDQLDLLAELERQFSDRVEPAGRLRLLPVSRLPELPSTAVLPLVELVESPARIASSSVLLRFRLLDGERLLGLHAVTFRVQVLAEVWIPAERLTPGTVLGAAEVETREVDLVRESRAVVADPALFGRYEITRTTSPDRPLTWNDLAPRALVRKGQLVDVVASGGLLSVAMKGQATRSAALGEVVVIRNLESKREFSAEVIDENKVRVHF